MKYLETKINHLFMMVLGVLAVGLLFPVFAMASETEILYLTDSAVANDGTTFLYQVNLDDNNNRANLTLLKEFPYEQVDAMAATADGSMIYLIDKGTSKIGTYNVDSEHFYDTGDVIKDGGTRITGIVLAAFSPQGDLFIASDDTNKVYTVDIVTGEATSKGKVKVGGSDLDISGADLAFLTDGTMYVWVNNGTLNGLFEVANPYSTPLTGVQIGDGQNTYFTGLAVRENGTGDLVGSETNIHDAIIVVSKANASFVETYPMYKDDTDTLYDYSWGDMTAGPIIKPLEVSKTVDTSYSRTWDWSIDKRFTNSQDNVLNLTTGETYDVGYDVTVDPTKEDSNWEANGTITITNPNVHSAKIKRVTDAVGFSAADVTCPVSFPYTLGAGNTLECTYTIDLLSGYEATNTATVETYEGELVPGGTGSALVTFGAPTIETDECVDVNDNNAADGLLGEVCATDGEIGKTFSYNLTFSDLSDSNVMLECGNNTHMNTAGFTTNDTMTTGQDTVTVSATLACGYECTYTQGYWKTHSSYGPASHPDDTWALVGGPDAPFFLSGQTYYEVLQTPPKGGNTYYQLAHQYIATELNIKNGASMPADVQTAFSSATAWFDVYAPEYLELPKGQVSNAEKKAAQKLRNEAVVWAGVLGNYNEGLVGPGHCDGETMTYEQTETFEQTPNVFSKRPDVFSKKPDVSSKRNVTRSQVFSNNTTYCDGVSGAYRFTNKPDECGTASTKWTFQNGSQASFTDSHGWMFRGNNFPSTAGSIFNR